MSFDNKKYHCIETHNILNYTCMIKDRLRNEFFYKALQKHASEKIVLDMGAGTGILSFYALSHGAKFVYVIEQSKEMSEIADKILSENFDRSRFKILNLNFWDGNLNEHINHKIDVLVSETVGPGLFDQGMLYTWHHIKEFISSDFISIPDTLSINLWSWEQSPDENIQFEEPAGNATISEYEVIDKNFFLSLIKFDKLLSKKLPIPLDSFLEDKKIQINRWVNLNHILIQSKKVIENIFHYNFNNIPNMLLESKPKIEKEFDFYPNTNVALVNKISFENETLYLNDAKYMPWKFSPFFEIYEEGTYLLKYINFNYGHMEKDWILVDKIRNAY